MFDRSFILGSLFLTALVSAQTISVVLGVLIAPALQLEARPPPDPPAADPVPLTAFLERNLFAARRGSPIGPPASCPAIDLGARLVATIVGRTSLAWIDREGELALIRIGDRIGGREVLAIERRAIRIGESGSCGEIGLAELEHPAAPGAPAKLVRRSSDQEVSVSRGDLEAALADPMRFARDARIVPKVNQGFALFAIKPGGVVDQLGSQNGDVLEQLDGRRLDEPRSWFSPLELIDKPELTIDYTRRGVRRTLTVRIE